MLRRAVLCAILAGLTLPLVAAAQQPAPAEKKAAPSITAIDTRAITWSDLEVPGFAPGLKIAPLVGDPSKPNEPYTLRLRFPDGYAFPAHYHPQAENLTVIAGTFYLGHGAKADNTMLERYVVGDYLNIPAKMPHYGQVRGETVIQLHGIGPFDIALADANAAKKP